MKQLEIDKTYASALAKTLTKIQSPATVGLYCSCQDRLNVILKQMEEDMEKIEKKNKKEMPCCSFVLLIFRMLFFKPAWTKINPHDTHHLHLIHVHFSAWHFAGSDLLWAGIAMRLLETIQAKFGKMKIVLFRTTQHDEEEEVQAENAEPGPNHWKTMKILGIPRWCFFLILIAIPIIILIILKTVDFPEDEEEHSEQTDEEADLEADMVEDLFFASLGLPVAWLAKNGFSIVKNTIFSQVGNIRRAMDNDRMSSQLGFMNTVRKEMWILSRFIQFMEVFEGQRIRIVLKITNLECCAPKKIVGVLDAMNILLSDKESPFISILAVDPHVLLEKINFADGRYTKQERAYALLNHIVTLSFTVPMLDEKLRSDLFDSIVNDQISTYKSQENGSKHNSEKQDEFKVEVVANPEECYPLTARQSFVNEDEKKDLVWRIMEFSKTRLSQYMVDDIISMRRVINSIWVSVNMLEVLNIKLPKPKSISAWLVLANQWPCRLSWIIQCVEDQEQMATDAEHIDQSTTLLKVFNDSRNELYNMKSQIMDLLEQDGDPEVFEKMLGEEEFEFTVHNLQILQSKLVNLDKSIKKELAQIRSTTNLKKSDTNKDLAPLPMEIIINMTKEEICQKMEILKFDKTFIDIIRSNDINGSALVYGDVQDLKPLLGMNFGQWSTFKQHFLRFSPQK